MIFFANYGKEENTTASDFFLRNLVSEIFMPAFSTALLRAVFKSGKL